MEKSETAETSMDFCAIPSARPLQPLGALFGLAITSWSHSVQINPLSVKTSSRAIHNAADQASAAPRFVQKTPERLNVKMAREALENCRSLEDLRSMLALPAMKHALSAMTTSDFTQTILALAGNLKGNSDRGMEAISNAVPARAALVSHIQGTYDYHALFDN